MKQGYKSITEGFIGFISGFVVNFLISNLRINGYNYC